MTSGQRRMIVTTLKWFGWAFVAAALSFGWVFYEDNAGWLAIDDAIFWPFAIAGVGCLLLRSLLQKEWFAGRKNSASKNA